MKTLTLTNREAAIVSMCVASVAAVGVGRLRLAQAIMNVAHDTMTGDGDVWDTLTEKLTALEITGEPVKTLLDSND